MRFIQEEILGMNWLNRLIGSELKAVGLDGGAIQFFLYDSLKIMALLCVTVLLVSYAQSYFPPERSKRILGRFRGVTANCVAAALGAITPFCSCSSIPLFIGFTGAGLPLGMTFSFLIASPMINPASLLLLMGIFGWKVAAAYVALGLAIAVLGGGLIGSLHMESQVEDFILNAPKSNALPRTPTFQERVKYSWEQAVATAASVFPYVLLGVGIGAAIHNWIPQDFVAAALGGENPLGVPIAVAVGVPMYADIFGVIPVAEALLSKGAFLGVVLSFMMAVTALSLPSMVMLRKAIKPKLLGAFIAVCTAGIILVGYFFNAMQGALI